MGNYPFQSTNIVPKFNVLNFGAANNGTTDDTLAIIRAVAAAQAVNGIIYMPAGPGYLISSNP